MPIGSPQWMYSSGAAYSIDNSCRFDNDSSPNMTRTPSGASNQKTFTLSVWLKLSSGTQATSYYGQIFGARTGSSSTYGLIQMLDDGGGRGAKLHFGDSTGASCKATRLLRDVSAWYHVVYKIDSTESTDTDRVKIYINGEETTLDSPTLPSENQDFTHNSTSAHHIGSQNSTDYFDGYMAEMHFIDGTALTPSSFGEAGDYGEWKAKEVSGLTYGTNGFYLDFKNAGVVYTTGDRSSTITATSSGLSFGGGTITNLVNGSTTGANATNAFYFSAGTPSGGSYIRFQFATTIILTEAKWYSEGTTANGVWRWQGSNDASDWTNIGGTFTLNGATLQLQTELSGNTTSYTYYQLLYVSGDVTGDDFQFEMEFATGTPATNGLGTDASGEDNHFTPTNISTFDQSLDSPTNNFSTLNHLAKALNDTLSEGDLKKTGTSTQSRTCSTFGFDSGKWYAEYYVHTRGSDNPSLGISDAAVPNARNTIHVGDEAGSFGYYSTAAGAANVNHGGTGNNGGTYSVYTNGHIIGVGLNIDDSQVTFYNNGANAVTSGVTYETLTLGMTYNFAVGTNGTGVMIANFGQDGTFAGNVTAGGNADDNGYGNFKYAPPTGFLAACSKNLPSPTVVPSEHFKIMLYDDGAGAKTFASHGIPAETGFQPDLVWLKASGITSDHHVTDAVRGVTKELIANLAYIEATDSAGLTAFGSDGFTVGTDDHYDDTTGAGMVAWCWKGGNATLGTGDFTQGSIASTCSRNVDAGFSIVSWTGTGSLGTVGHGLSVKPDLIIARDRDYARSWIIGSKQTQTSMDFTDGMIMDTADAIHDQDGYWADTDPTATVFTVKDADNTNRASDKFIAYCFHNVEGYSKIGSYAGNGNADDGTFVYTGFKSRWIVCKRIGGTGSWNIYDTARANNNNNPVRERLPANLNYAAEPSSFAIDVLSNGFKHYNSDNEMNASESYLFMAFAETPFKLANSR